MRVTVNNEDAAAAVPAIVEGLDRLGVARADHRRLPLQRPPAADASIPTARAALAKYRINPGNVGRQARTTSNFRAIIEVAIAHDKPVRIGVNWGSLDQQLLTEMMDANARRAEPRDARDVTMEAMVESALRSAALAESRGPAARPDHPQRQGLRRAGPGGRLPHAGGALRLPAAPRAHRGGDGDEGDRRQHRGARRSCCRRASATPSACR